MEQTVTYLLMTLKFLNLKQKTLKLMQFHYFQETFHKGFSVENMKKTGFYGYANDFGIDFDAIAVDDILDIHKYLMKKNNMK